MTDAALPMPADSRPWKRAFLWLLFLVPFFYVSYGGANWLAGQREDVGSWVFGWEQHIPFLAWTIIPYWTINAFYGLSPFICRTRTELDAHCRRLLTAQVIAVFFFIVTPLRFTFDHAPVTEGFTGFLFTALDSFDRPFNQAPSLHIAILVILWPLYERHAPRWALAPLHIWFALIGASVLTTYQHHFIDIPTGVLLGLACLWLWPDDRPSPLAGARLTRDRKRRALAFRYAAGGVLFAAIAVAVGGWALLLLWPAVSLGLVATNYALLGAAGFQKAEDGRMSLAARVLLAPYLLGAFINSRLWTRRDPAPREVVDGVWIGRIPTRREGRRQKFAAIVDVSAELPAMGRAARYHALPMLDLTTPEADWLASAAERIERSRRDGHVLVACALGYSRSAAALVCWSLRSGRHASVDQAIDAIRRVRPRIVLDAEATAAIDAAARK